MNSRAIRSPRAVRKRGDHSLAGVDRHVAEAGLALAIRLVVRLGVDLDHDRDRAEARSTAASTSSWNDGGSGTATQSYGRESSSSRTWIAKSPEPWMIGMTRIRGLIVRKSSAVAPVMLIDRCFRNQGVVRMPVAHRVGRSVAAAAALSLAGERVPFVS